MKPLIHIMTAATLACGLTACTNNRFLEQRTIPERAAYGADPIPYSPASAEANTVTHRTTTTIDTLLPPQVTGTWTFTTPPTITRVEKRTDTFDQFTLFNGRPGPEDRPFLVITVGKDRTSIAEANPGTYKISNTREYVLNGNVAQEWTGLTDGGAGFCELIVRRPGTEGQTGDVCHATALARNEEEQKLALPILASIVWKESR